MSDLPPDVVPSPPDANDPEHNYDAWIGRNTYVDGDPEPVGPIAEIFYDSGTQRPEWLVLTDRHLVPIPGSTLGGPYNDLYLGFDKDRIAQAPTVAAGATLTVEQEQDLYAYYGFDWDAAAPDPLPPRFDDGWDTGWLQATPVTRSQATPATQSRTMSPDVASVSPTVGEAESRMLPFTPTITPPPPPPEVVPVDTPQPEV